MYFYGQGMSVGESACMEAVLKAKHLMLKELKIRKKVFMGVPQWKNQQQNLAMQRIQHSVTHTVFMRHTESLLMHTSKKH